MIKKIALIAFIISVLFTGIIAYYFYSTGGPKEPTFVKLENTNKNKIQFADFKDYENSGDLNNSYFSLIDLDEHFDMLSALKALMNITHGE